MRTVRNEVAALARRAAERHAETNPGEALGTAWLATAFLGDLPAVPDLESLWLYYVEVAMEHRAVINLDRTATIRIGFADEEDTRP